jgi:hypothetical protein
MGPCMGMGIGAFIHYSIVHRSRTDVCDIASFGLQTLTTVLYSYISDVS